MTRPHPAPQRTHGLALPAALAALAVLLRLLLPPMPAPAESDDALALLLSGGGICHADPSAPAPEQGGLPCPVCPLCAGPAAVLLPAPPALPGRTALAALPRLILPPSIAPPAAGFAIAQPRGPPALSA